MTLIRRVEAMETSLTPTQLVLRWLEAAHDYGDLGAAVDALLAEDEPEPPLDRLCREALAGVQVRLRGKSPEMVLGERRRVLRETVFRYLLVLRIETTTRELLDREALVYAALSAQLAILAGEDHGALRGGETYLERLATLCHATHMRVAELQAMANARCEAERRFLDSHEALFPVTAKEWAEQVERTAGLACLAERFAELSGLEPLSPTYADEASARSDVVVGRLVEPAKAQALDQLGDGQRAFAVATAWLRTRLASPTLTPPHTQGLEETDA